MGKRNLILVILLIIIAGIVIFSLNQEKQSEKVTHYYPFKDIKLNNIKEIKIKNFTIKNLNGTWKIDNVTCNMHKIEYLLNLLKNQDFSNVISDNKNNFEKFNVSGKGAISIEIKTSDNRDIKLDIGKITPDGNGCYIRYNDKVYLITQNIKIDFNKDKQDFYLNKTTRRNNENKSNIKTK